MLLLKKIATPWDEFLNAWREIHKILQTIKKSKRIALEDAMSNYIFKSRKEDKSRLEEVIMGRRVLTAYERAVEEGKFEGKLEGILEGKLQIAKMMREEGDSFERIVRITGLSLEILKEHNLI